MKMTKKLFTVVLSLILMINLLAIQTFAASATVSFDPNGATGTMADITIADDLKPFTLPENGFTAPPGKEFIGWYPNTDAGDGTAFECVLPGQSFELDFMIQDGKATFYPVWATRPANTVKLTFIISEEYVEIAMIIFVPKGEAFDLTPIGEDEFSISTTPDGNNIITSITPTSDTILYTIMDDAPPESEYEITINPKTEQTFTDVKFGYTKADVTPLTYTIHNIGDAEITNLKFMLNGSDGHRFEIDTTELASLKVGAGISVNITPVLGLPQGVKYTANLRVVGDGIDLTDAPNFSLSVEKADRNSTLTPSPHTFPSLNEGYLGTDLTPLTLTYTNTGSETITNLKVELWYDDKTKFTVDTTGMKTTLTTNESTTFTVVPIEGLSVGNYNTTVRTISDQTNNSSQIDFTVIDSSIESLVANVSLSNGKYGKTITATVTGANSTDLVYTWKNGTTILGTGLTYTPTDSDIGEVLTFEVTANDKAGVVSKDTNAIEKADGGKAPSAPTLSSVGKNQIIVYMITGQEYSLDGITWQTSGEFNGLTPNTSYSIYTRVMETNTTNASDISSPINTKTLGDGIIIVRETQTLTFPEYSITKTTSDSPFDYPVQGAKTDVTYTSNNHSVATVDNTGRVTIIGVGEAIIEAHAEETERYQEGSSEYTLTVVEGSTPPTVPTVSQPSYTVTVTVIDEDTSSTLETDIIASGPNGTLYTVPNSFLEAPTGFDLVRITGNTSGTINGNVIVTVYVKGIIDETEEVPEETVPLAPVETDEVETTTEEDIAETDVPLAGTEEAPKTGQHLPIIAITGAVAATSLIILSRKEKNHKSI